MFEIESHSPPSGSSETGKIEFAYERGHVKGGWQGGRGWDKQSPHLADATKPGYILAGGLTMLTIGCIHDLLSTVH